MINNNIEELKIKLNEYFNGEISKEYLGRWANIIYYDILKGGFLEKDKLVIYPFVKKISLFGIEPNEKEDIYPTEEEEIRYIEGILSGDYNFQFQVNVSIPLLLYTNRCNSFLTISDRNLYLELAKLIDSYKLNQISIEKIKEQTQKISIPRNKLLITDELQYIIALYCETLFSSDVRKHNGPISLYSKRKEEISLDKLERYVDYYIGEKEFQVGIKYEKSEIQCVLFL